MDALDTLPPTEGAYVDFTVFYLAPCPSRDVVPLVARVGQFPRGLVFWTQPIPFVGAWRHL